LEQRLWRTRAGFARGFCGTVRGLILVDDILWRNRRARNSVTIAKPVGEIAIPATP